MRLPRFVIDNYTRALKGIDTKSAIAVSKMLANVDWSDKKASVEKVCEAMEQLCQYSADSAAELAATFYDTLCAGATGEFAGAIAYSARTQGHSIPYVEKAIEDSGGDIEELGRSLSGIASYGTKRAAGETVRRNARRLGYGYARVPGGSETCNFCIMLASRGLVWETEKSALSGKIGDGHYHENCQCTVVPVFDKGDVIEGFDYKKYLDMYENPENYPEIREARNARRRELRRERKEAIAKEEFKRSKQLESGEAKSVIASKILSQKVNSNVLFDLAEHVDAAAKSGDDRRVNAAKLFNLALRSVKDIEVKDDEDSSFFSPFGNKVVLNSFGRSNPRTIIHELVHYADWNFTATYNSVKIGKDGSFSASYSTEGGYTSLLFGKERPSKTLANMLSVSRQGETSSWRKLKRGLGAGSDNEAIRIIASKVVNASIGINETSSLSDIIHSSSNGSVRILAGHFPDKETGRPYWSNSTRPIEMIADYGASAVTNQKEFELICELFPEEASLIDEMIEAMINAHGL